MSIVAGVMTFPRQGVNYLPDTLRSIRSQSSGRVTPIVCVGKDCRAHVPLDAACFPMSEDDWLSIAAMPALYRITRTMLHTFRTIRQVDADLYVVFEDDILASKDWDVKTARFADIANKSAGASWVMALCSSHDDCDFHVVGNGIGSRLFKHKDPRQFWGQQAVMYPAHVLDMMIDYTESCLASWKPDLPVASGHNYRRCGDQVVKWFCWDDKRPLLVTDPSLALHVGKECSWSGGASVAFQHPTKRFVQ